MAKHGTVKYKGWSGVLDDEPAVAGTIWPVGEVAQVRLEMFDSGAITVCSLKPMNEVVQGFGW